MHIGLLGTVRTPDGQVRPELLPHLPDGTSLSAWPSRVGAFPSTPVERTMQALGHLEAGLRAAGAGAGAGVDAVAIDSIGDYGLDALRAALAIPVAGSGEAGLAAAARHGRFGIVTVWPVSMNFVPVELLAKYGLTDQCTGIRNVGDEAVIGNVAGPEGYLGQIHRADAAILARVAAEVGAAVADGAQAVMLGCTCMSPMAARLAAMVSVPIVNPLAEGAAAAAALAACTPRPEAPIRTERAAAIKRMVDAAANEEDESCPVCVSAAAFE